VGNWTSFTESGTTFELRLIGKASDADGTRKRVASGKTAEAGDPSGEAVASCKDAPWLIGVVCAVDEPFALADPVL
jgi:hypothetical protein